MTIDPTTVEKGTSTHVRVNTDAVPAPSGPPISRRIRSLPWRSIALSVLIFACFGAVAGVLGALATRYHLSVWPASADVPVTELSAVNASSYLPAYLGALHTYLNGSDLQDRDINVDYDAIVIGAGAAGLAAATTLQAGGLDVLVIEAQVCSPRS